MRDAQEWGEGGEEGGREEEEGWMTPRMK